MESPLAVGLNKWDASQPYRISEAHVITRHAQIKRCTPINFEGSTLNHNSTIEVSL